MNELTNQSIPINQSLNLQKGPGAELGNLYYFTWASFLTAFMLLASCVEDYNAAASTSTQTHEDQNDIEPVVIHSAPSGDSVPSP